MASSEPPLKQAPKITLKDQDGASVALESLWRQGPLVVFFYPKDNTPGCTKEVCHFRDAYEAFVAAKSQVVGISQDGQESHQGFAAKHGLKFRLLTDPDGAARKSFGVKKTLGLMPGRQTFVISPQGEICYSFSSQINTLGHVDNALEVVKKLAAQMPDAQATAAPPQA